MNRSITIERLRNNKGLTLQAIGSKLNPPITGERVRQILQSKEKALCDTHQIYYTKSCRYCNYEKNYQKLLDTIKKRHLEEEIGILSQIGRSGEQVLKRKLLIKKLHDDPDLKMSFSKIAKLLKRDRTTISAYYYGSSKKQNEAR